MAKKDETVEDKVEVVNQPDGAPIAPDAGEAMPSRETLSHQWQKDSPALNTNVLAGYAVASIDNIIEKTKAAEEAAKVEPAEKETISAAEFERRTKLDVSDKQYINPSLDHQNVKK